LEHLDQPGLCRYIEKEELVTFKSPETIHCSGTLYKDDAASSVWSVNVVVGNEDETYLKGSVPLFPYSKLGEPNSVFGANPMTLDSPASGQSL
jgi:hypothetical protein